MHPKAERIAALLGAEGVAAAVLELPQSTRTAAEAAATIGTTIAQIAKSLVFLTMPDEEVVVVVASGSNQVDLAKVSATIGSELRRPDAKSVKVLTGYSIGGVPPFAYDREVRTLIDSDLLRYGELWAAAGTPNAVFRLTPDELLHLSGGTVGDVRVDPA